jgi:hypothetical protein
MLNPNALRCPGQIDASLMGTASIRRWRLSVVRSLYASGSNDPTANGSGTYSTFNQLFPFSHYYLGRLDLVARQNNQDFNTHLRLYPTKWLQLWTQYHPFELANSHDALYAASGSAGRNVGDELDFIVNFHLSATTEILLGYSQFYLGSFLIRTGTKIAPDQFFLQSAGTVLAEFSSLERRTRKASVEESSCLPARTNGKNIIRGNRRPPPIRSPFPWSNRRIC